MKRYIRASSGFSTVDASALEEALQYVDRWVDYSRPQQGVVTIKGLPVGAKEEWKYLIHIGNGSIQISRYHVEGDVAIVDSLSDVDIISYDISEVDDLLPPEVAQTIKDVYSYRDRKRQERSKKASNRAAKYTFYVCNNERAANRGYAENPDTFDITTIGCASERDAFQQAYRIIYGRPISPEEDPWEAVEDQDVGAGWPIVYGIKRGNTWVYQHEFFDGFEDTRVNGEEY